MARSPSEKSGSLLGGILLIAGSCIGAGMLGLPILTGLAGFFPSLLVFLCAWAFMTLTGLLLVEVNHWLPARVNIVSMAGHTLGNAGRILSWILYLFLFYSLLVAYVSGSGSLFSTAFPLPEWAGSLFFVGLFGGVIYLGTSAVDMWNRVLMMGKIGCFLGLVFFGISHIKPALLLQANPAAAAVSLPILIISFGFHNMIPTLTTYFNGDVKRVRLTILGGSLFALVIYLIWEVIILGIIPIEGSLGILESLKQDKEASQALAAIVGSSWIGTFAQGLAAFALLTSFLAQALSLVHFLADGLKMKEPQQRENFALCLLALLPPLFITFSYPQLFFKALNFAGGFCATILFGLLPVAMVWIGRYRKKIASPYVVRGGKPLLVAIFPFALFIVLLQLSDMVGHPLLPKP